MAKKKGGAGRVAKAGGAAAGVSADAPPPREFNQGDLVLAKVKGWPAWPAQVERLETEGKHVGKYYVTYFGPGQQIGWCTPAELSDFDADQKEASRQRSKRKVDKKFNCALDEICAVQDERAGITHKDSADENADVPDDDAPRDSGLDGQEDDTAKEGDVISDVKHDDPYLTQVVTLNQQDDSVPFNDANPEEDVEDDDAEKDWNEKPEYNGSDLHSGRSSEGRGQRQQASLDDVVGEGLKSFVEGEEADSEPNVGTRRAFRNALKKLNETAEKDPESKTEIPESEGHVLTYQYGRKKNRNKNNNIKDEPPFANGAGAIAGQEVVQDSAPSHAETSDFQKKMKPKVGRPSKVSQQGKMGGRDGKPNFQPIRRPNPGDKDFKSDKGNGGSKHDGSGKFSKDPSKNGHIKKGPYSKKKDMFNSSVKESVLAGEKRALKLEDKKDVKSVSSEGDRFKKGPKKSKISSKGFEEGKKHSAALKLRDDHVKSNLDEVEKKVTTPSSLFLGGSKSKGDPKGESSLKRKRFPDGEGEGKEENTSVERERGDAGTSPKTDVDEKHLPLSKRPKMLASEDKLLEGKQKHLSVGRSGLDGGNVEKYSPRDGKSRERGTSLPPKADKDRMRKAALDGEAALPPSKRRNRAFAAMTACEAEAATASAAESREQPENGVSSNQAGSNVTATSSSETLKKEGTTGCGLLAVGTASPLKNATVTPDISKSDGGHKSLKVGSGHDNFGGQERVESRKHLPIKDTQATDSPSKQSGSEDPRESKRGSKRGPHGKSDAEGLVTKGFTSPVPTKSSLEGGTEKRKGHLTGSESGKMSTATAEAFPSLAKPVLEDSIIKNAVALANEKRNALKREGDSSASMKVLIAAAQAKQRARQYSTGGSGSLGFAEFDKVTNSMACSPSPSQRRGSSRLTSPIQHGQAVVMDLHDRLAGWNSSVDERSGVLSAEPTIDTEATIARDTFVGMLETVSRTKESIGRTTRQAMDCAKHGIAEQIVEIIVRKLENEPSFHRRVDFWFLLDSVTQVAHTQKVLAYLPIVQDSLPRILNAAAPPGGVARENRKQCLKVLNLWLERKVMPESILRHFMNEIESHNDDKGLPGGGHRRLSRYERGVDDPVRDMDGMLVDEYGSNASLNLPDGFSIIPQLYEDDDEGSEDDDKKLETQSLNTINTTRSTEAEDASEKFRTVLEDVDGELEMEDVSPTADSELLANKERERLLADHFTEEAQSNPTQPPLPLEPPPSVPSPPPLPADPPPSPPPPPRSPPPPLTTSQSKYPKAGIAIMQNSTRSQESNHQQSDSPSTPSAYSGHQGQGNLALSQSLGASSNKQTPARILSQGGSRSNPYPTGSMSQLAMPLESPLPPPSQHSSPGFAQGPSTGTRLPPPPPLPPAFRPQRVWSDTLASPAGDSDISPRLARLGEEQVRQGLQEVSGGERVGGELPSAQQDVGPAHSGGCTSSGPPEGAKPGDQSSAGAMSGYSSNPPLYLNQDQIYRMNSSVRPGPGAQFQYGPPVMQPPMRGRPFGGHFSPHAQYQGSAMNPPGSQGPMQMLAFRPGGPSHSSWRPA